MPLPQPTDFRFIEKDNAFAFRGEVRGRVVESFITSEAVDALFGKHTTPEGRIRAMTGRSYLIQLVGILVDQGESEPVWLTSGVLQSLKVTGN